MSDLAKAITLWIGVCVYIFLCVIVDSAMNAAHVESHTVRLLVYGFLCAIVIGGTYYVLSDEVEPD